MAAPNFFESSPGINGTGVARAREATATAVETSAEREARIEALRDQYRHGTYRVDSKALAARIIEQHIAK